MPYTLPDIFNECLLSTKEDSKRIAAAVTRQAIHLASDKYCVEGLPIPFLSTINPEKAQSLIEKGWNNVEFEKILKHDIQQISTSAAISVLINSVISVLYWIGSDNYDYNLQMAKLLKILSISDCIAVSSNILTTAVSKNLAKIDIGGFGVAMLELMHTAQFVTDIKQEFINNNFKYLIEKGDMCYEY